MAGQIINRGKNIWLVRVYLGRDSDTGKREYENKTVHGQKKDAEAEAAKLVTQRDRGVLRPGGDRLTLDALLDDVLTDYRMQGRRALSWVKILVTTHLKPFFGSVPASKLNTAAIDRYMRSRKAEGRAPATIGNELAILRRALNLAFRAGKIGRVLFIPKPKVQNARQGFLEPEQYKTLRDALPDHLKPLFVVAYHTGIRLGELRALEWPQVDLLAGEIRLAGSQTKTAEPRTVPIYGEMRPFIEMAIQERNEKYADCPWVFHYCGRRIGAHLKGWKAACEKAGLPELHFHDLRRSAVRAMERAGIPRHVAMSISGHRTEAVYRRYDIVSPRDLQAAGRQLEAYLKDKLDEKSNGRPEPEKIATEKLAHNRHTFGKGVVQ